MQLFEVFERRCSIRCFEPEPVDPGHLDTILEAVRRTPSAGNLQAYRVLVVTDKTRRREFADAALGQAFVADAPLLLVFSADPGRSAAKYGLRGSRLYSIQDATIACCFAMLAATALGYGSVWVGAFDTDRVQDLIGAGDELLPVALLPIGKAAESPESTGRRRFEEVIHFDR